MSVRCRTKLSKCLKVFAKPLTTGFAHAGARREDVLVARTRKEPRRKVIFNKSQCPGAAVSGNRICSHD